MGPYKVVAEIGKKPVGPAFIKFRRLIAGQEV
jgi:hypothetical protein